MSEVIRKPPLLSGSIGLRASGWWGMVFLVMSEASVFSYLFFAYFYFAVNVEYRPWPPYGAPSLRFALPETLVVLLAAAAMWFADHRAAIGLRVPSLIGLLIAALFGIGFIALGLADWKSKPFSLSSSVYSSIYFVLTGAHLVHVVVGVVMSAAVLVWSAIGYLGPVRHVPVTVAALYWYFVAASWLAVFFVLYITPYLGGG
jgi:heme/copper-type cytochrome/quinol oxidase subunit 3